MYSLQSTDVGGRLVKAFYKKAKGLWSEYRSAGFDYGCLGKALLLSLSRNHQNHPFSSMPEKSDGSIGLQGPEITLSPLGGVPHLQGRTAKTYVKIKKRINAELKRNLFRTDGESKCI